MNRLDRYILQQLIGAFGFFVLVFTGVVWLTQAVRLIDTVIAGGQSAAIFLQFSVLVLPQVFIIVLPLSGIGAALNALNKLYTDSELIVMMTSGLGPPRLIRPVAVFGAMVGAMMAVVMMVLVPRAGTELAERTQAVRSDLAHALIVERQFLHPMSGLTLFITDTGTDGDMEGIFLHDQRDPLRPVTYSAERARLLREGDEARLVMLDGVALSPNQTDTELNSVSFDQFVFDLSDLIRKERNRTPRPAEYSVRQLLAPTEAMFDGDRYDRGDFIAEAHYKLAMPLLAFIYPLIALVTLLAGGYRRAGFGRRVVVAIGVAVFIQILMFIARPRVQEQPELWPLIYVPFLLALGYIGALLMRLRSLHSPRALQLT